MPFMGGSPLYSVQGDMYYSKLASKESLSTIN